VQLTVQFTRKAAAGTGKSILSSLFDLEGVKPLVPAAKLRWLNGGLFILSTGEQATFPQRNPS
jgi:hypothetical protein